MKIFTLCLFVCIGLQGFSQNTYYWVGGAGPSSFTATGNWNTSLDGSGDSRSVAGAQDSDVLIFDGANIGGSSLATGKVVLNSSTATIGRLIFQNNADVQFSRSSAGSSNINIMGDGTNLDDLVINRGCTVTLGGNAFNYDARFLLGLTTPSVTVATASVSGELYLSPLSSAIHTASFITSRTTNGLVFEAGANCYVTDSTTASPFNGSANNSVLFKAGSSLHYYTGRSPFGNSSATQFTNFEQGSNFYVKGFFVSYLDGSTAYASSSWANQKSFANIIVQNGATFRSDGPIYRIDTLVIDAGSSFLTHSSGQTPVLGDLIVNGTLSAPSGSNGLVMGGDVLQTISGTGTIDIPNFVVANYSNVVLNKPINVSSSTNIVGKINFGAVGRIAGAGTFTARVASTAVSGAGSIAEGAYQLSYAAPGGINGYKISGPGLSPNTNVIGFGASANIVYLSKPAISTVTNDTYTFESDTATLQTANTNGFDEATGSIISSGNKSFQGGVHYIIDASTAHPFAISSSNPSSIVIGNLEINSTITTNYNTRISGVLTLNAGKLNIRPADTVRILNGSVIEGAPFNSSKYIVSQRAVNNVGVLRIDDLQTAYLPIGTATNYLPVNITAASASDFALSVFEGVTIDGSIDGTTVSTAQKNNLVDAVWNIDRVIGSGSAIVSLSWPETLEGSIFTGLPDALIGIARHNGSDWDAASGSADNIANTASHDFTDFSPFIVKSTAVVLPVTFAAISGTINNGKANIQWKVAEEISIVKYEIEKSTDRINFLAVGSVPAAQRSTYSFNDVSILTGVTYYRLKITGQNAEIKYSEIVVLKPGKNLSINIYPNPASEFVNITGLKNNSIIRIFNAAGHLLLQQHTNDQFTNVNLKTLLPGTYFIEVFNEGKRTSSNTFVKQ